MDTLDFGQSIYLYNHLFHFMSFIDNCYLENGGGDQILIKNLTTIWQKIDKFSQIDKIRLQKHGCCHFGQFWS